MKAVEASQISLWQTIKPTLVLLLVMPCAGFGGILLRLPINHHGIVFDHDMVFFDAVVSGALGVAAWGLFHLVGLPKTAAVRAKLQFFFVPVIWLGFLVLMGALLKNVIAHESSSLELTF